MTIANKVDVCNLALDHLGKPPIADINEGSPEAQACKRQYDVARRIMLSRSPWTFALSYDSLSRLTDNALESVWPFRYDKPNKSVKIHRLTAGLSELPNNEPPVPMMLANSSIYTHVDDAWVLHTSDHENPLMWSAQFADALGLFIAFRLAPQMTRRRSDVEQLREYYSSALDDAIEHDAAQQPTTYGFHQDGYIDARGASTRQGRRQVDGSTIWE